MKELYGISHAYGESLKASGEHCQNWRCWKVCPPAVEEEISKQETKMCLKEEKKTQALKRKHYL